MSWWCPATYVDGSPLGLDLDTHVLRSGFGVPWWRALLDPDAPRTPHTTVSLLKRRIVFEMTSTPSADAATAFVRSLAHRIAAQSLDSLDAVRFLTDLTAAIDHEMARRLRDLPEDISAADLAAALGTSKATAWRRRTDATAGHHVCACTSPAEATTPEQFLDAYAPLLEALDATTLQEVVTANPSIGTDELVRMFADFDEPSIREKLGRLAQAAGVVHVPYEDSWYPHFHAQAERAREVLRRRMENHLTNSTFQSHAASQDGATGLFQTMPSTWGAAGRGD